MRELKPISGREFYEGDYIDLIYQLNIGGHTTKYDRDMICTVIAGDAARAGYKIKSLPHFVGWLTRYATELGR